MGTLVQLGLFMTLCFGVNGSYSQLLQRHKRNWIIDSFTIHESYKGPFPYSLGTINVDKNFIFFMLEGQGATKEPKDIIRINRSTGELTVHGPVDYEKFQSLKLSFQAMNKVNGLVDTRLSVEIMILDENDNAPGFERETYQVTVEESTAQGADLIAVKATDKDITERYHKFDLRIVSITPKAQDLEFYLTQSTGFGWEIGRISFKGCLDHEKAENYSIIVEAKDRGPVQLSSSCTVIINIKDGNNHLPVITGQTGPGTVKEGQENVLVKRLQVTDRDSKGTEAWRARFQIQGDANNNFRIATDPDTNEGLLYVQKPLDYELERTRNITVTVENEIPFRTCKVERRAAVGLWMVSVTDGASPGSPVRPFASTVTVTVEDVNEPPVFDEPDKTIYVRENDNVTSLWKFTARDPEVSGANAVVYVKERDPAGFIKVDRDTGNVTLVKAIDRESHYVRDSIYVASVRAIDRGEPPMTSTATLSIFVVDVNDNAPSLNGSSIDMCQTDGASRADVTAVDPDMSPYGGPFAFRLLGDFNGRWKIDPEQGHSVSLVKEEMVHSGSFEFALEVSDLQGRSAVHSLTVTVCSCLDPAKPDCRVRVSTGSEAGRAALGMIALSLLLLAGSILSVCTVSYTVSYKETFVEIEGPDGVQSLTTYDDERPGTDCQVHPPNVSVFNDKHSFFVARHNVLNTSDYEQQKCWKNLKDRIPYTASQKCGPTISRLLTATKNTFQSMGAIPRFDCGPLVHKNWKEVRKSANSKYQGCAMVRQKLSLQLNKKLKFFRAAEAELEDYAPHVYAVEGDAETRSEFDAMDGDIHENLYFIESLDNRFTKLASICLPSEATASCNNNRPPIHIQQQSL